MDKKTAKKLKVGFGALIIILFVAIGFSALSGFVNPYKSVSEVVSSPDKFLNRQIQLEGRVVEETVRWVPNTLTFVLTDDVSQIQVTYEGVLPSNFPVGKDLGSESEIDVVVIGSLVSPNQFKAEQILVKCPSKYELQLNETV